MEFIAHNRKDRVGQKLQGWTVLKYITTIKKRPVYLIQCVCGYTCERNLKEIIAGRSNSCGCLNRKNHTIHGLTKTRVYNTWINIKTRCRNPRSDNYSYYGARGIDICNEWYGSFKKFYDYIGTPDSDELSIDRIDNNGNYEPGNVRWATKSQQALNRRPTKPLPTPPKV